MDTAVQHAHRVEEHLVSAEEYFSKYHAPGVKDPSAISLTCPYCNRPVRFVPGGGSVPKEQRRRNPQGPHFRHVSNDPFTANCPEYQSGTAMYPEPTVPALPMFLRRGLRGRRFRLEFGVCRRGSGLARRLAEQEATMSLDGQEHDLAGMVANPDMTLEFVDPDLRPSRRLSVPPGWQPYVGCPQDGDAFLFNCDFGPNGGRRIPVGRDVGMGMPFYAVIGESRLPGLRACFDSVRQVGVVASSRARLVVAELCVEVSSGKVEAAAGWLSKLGFGLSSMQYETVPVWPPQLRANGVDEPLMPASEQVYQAPWNARQGMMDETVEPVSLRGLFGLDELRDMSLLGFAHPPRRDPQLEGFCCFVQVEPRLPWSAYMASMEYPPALRLAESAQARPCTVDADVRDVNRGLADGLRARRNRHYDVAMRRMSVRGCYMQPLGQVIGRVRAHKGKE